MRARKHAEPTCLKLASFAGRDWHPIAGGGSARQRTHLSALRSRASKPFPPLTHMQPPSPHVRPPSLQPSFTLHPPKPLQPPPQAGITWKFDVQSITRVKAGDMCDSATEKAVKVAHRKGGKGALNLYFTGAMKNSAAVGCRARACGCGAGLRASGTRTPPPFRPPFAPRPQQLRAVGLLHMAVGAGPQVGQAGCADHGRRCHPL